MEPDECIRNKPYKHPLNLKQMTSALIWNYPSLYAETGDFVHQDGAVHELMVIKGTIPVVHMNVKYNIPIAIWIGVDFPASPPIVFVTPTSSMLIEQNHKHVDLEGRCYLPYLSEWNGNTHDLITLCVELGIVFGTSPPVYARPQQSIQPKTKDDRHTHTTTSSVGSLGGVVGNSGNSGPRVHGGRPQITPTTTVSSPPPPSTSLNSGLQNLAVHCAGSKSNILSHNDEDIQLRREILLAKVISLIHLEECTEEDVKKTQKNYSIENMSLLEDLDNAKCQEIESRRKLEEESELDDWLRVHGNDDLSSNAAIAIADAPLSNQVEELRVEDTVHDDVLYCLDEALHKRTLDVDTWLKEFRDQCRGQYLTRALANKIEKTKIKASFALNNTNSSQSTSASTTTTSSIYPTPYSENLSREKREAEMLVLSSSPPPSTITSSPPQPPAAASSLHSIWNILRR